MCVVISGGAYVNAETLERIYQELWFQKKEIEARINQNEHYGLDQGMNSAIGELSGYDNHPADIGTEMFEREKDIALQGVDKQHLNDINRALERIEAGEYGSCKICEKSIATERLEAFPTAVYCMDHQPTMHASQKSRPIEEEVMDGNMRNRDQSSYNGYDGEDAWQEVSQYGTSTPLDHYVEVYIEHEHRGYVDIVEGFSITDASGSSSGITQITHNEAYRLKDREERIQDGEDTLL
nr:TraR/DksA C4-type zinc finger protein [Polycladospora coralii]